MRNFKSLPRGLVIGALAVVGLLGLLGLRGAGSPGAPISTDLTAPPAHPARTIEPAPPAAMAPPEDADRSAAATIGVDRVSGDDGARPSDRPRPIDVHDLLGAARLDPGQLAQLEEVALGSGDEALAGAARLVLEARVDRLWDDDPEAAALLSSRVESVAGLLDAHWPGASPAPPPRDDDLGTSWRDPEASVRTDAVCRLGATGREPDRRLLLEISETDPDPLVREAALRMLARTPDEAVAGLLERIAAAHAHETLGRMAARLLQTLPPTGKEPTE